MTANDSERFADKYSHHVPNLANSSPRTALAIARDDGEAKARVAAIVNDLGFDTVDAGALAESWSFEPESGAYTPIYAADEDGFAADYLADAGAPSPRTVCESYSPPRIARTSLHDSSDDPRSGTGPVARP